MEIEFLTCQESGENSRIDLIAIVWIYELFQNILVLDYEFYKIILNYLFADFIHQNYLENWNFACMPLFNFNETKVSS